jgi:hypothetical protein
MICLFSTTDPCTLYKGVWHSSHLKMLLFEVIDAVQLEELLIEEVTRVCITSESAQILLILLLLMFSFTIFLEGIRIL